MKHTFFTGFLLAIFMLTSSLFCEEEFLHFVVNEVTTTTTGVFTYEIDDSGAFSELHTLTSGDINSSLDIPSNAEVVDVRIQSFNLEIEVQEDNQASSVDFEMVYEISGGGQQDLLGEKNYNLGLDFISVNAAEFLIESGVLSISNEIESYLKGDSGSLTFYVLGDPEPLGNRAHILIFVQLTYTVKYEVCEEVPLFIDGIRDCE